MASSRKTSKPNQLPLFGVGEVDKGRVGRGGGGAMKVSVTFEERAKYTVELERPDAMTDDEFTDRWFELMETQVPDWFSTSLDGIDERKLISVEPVQKNRTT